MLLMIAVNLDVAISNNPIEMTSLSQNNIGNMQQISPFVQTTPPPLIGLSNCDHLYISNIVLSAGENDEFLQMNKFITRNILK